MLPRTDPNRRGGLYQVYVCNGRVQHGVGFCDQGPIDRAAIDGPMLAELQTLADLGGTVLEFAYAPRGVEVTES